MTSAVVRRLGGSVIDVTGICDGNGTLFTVTNSGAGNMQEAVA
ncbi:MAG: hypothetical protein R2788_02160 [Saprospiraceae bacterium]